MNESMHKKISVIVPCYNAANFLDTCLQSLEKQTIGMDNLEVILVNDASTDGTGEMLAAFERKYPESVIVVHLTENKKQGGARNIGLRYASGEYVVFLDADDWTATEFYEELYGIAKEYDTDIVQYPFRNVFVDENGIITGEGAEFPIKKTGFGEITSVEERKRFLMQRILPCGSQSKFYRREFLQQMQPRFVEGVAYEEPSFVYPMLFELKRYYWYDKPKYFVRNHAASTMRSYVRQKGKLYDHPYVQLCVYETMKQKTELYQIYQEEIDFYFLFTFYFETIQFAAKGGLYLGYDYFTMMQAVINKMCPGWKKNFYLNQTDNSDVFHILENGQKIATLEAFTDFLETF